jgi:hypothetical protein
LNSSGFLDSALILHQHIAHMGLENAAVEGIVADPLQAFRPYPIFGRRRSIGMVLRAGRQAGH